MVFGRFIEPQSYRKGIVLSVGLGFLAKAAAFLLNPAIAYYFGARGDTDIFFFCMSTVLLASAFLTSLNGSVVIPHAMHLSASEGDARSMSFTNAFFYFYLLAGSVITILVVLAPAEVLGAISNFPRNDLQQHITLIRVLALVFLLTIASSAMCDILFSRKFFAVPMISGLLTSLLGLAFLLLFHDALGTLSIAIGMLVAYLLQTVFLAIVMCRSIGWRFDLCSLQIGRRVSLDSTYAYLGNIASAAAGYVPLLLLGGFDPGTLTALMYAQSITNIPGAIVTSQYSSVAGIRLNEECAKGDWAGVNRVFLMSTNFLVFLLVPVACLMWLFSGEAVAVLFQHGKLTPETADLSTRFLKYLSLIVPMAAANTLVARLFMAGRRVAMSFWYQIAMNLLLILMIVVFVGQAGPTGYPVALVVSYGSSILFLYWLLKYAFPTIVYSSILRHLALATILNVPLYALAYAAKYTWPSLLVAPLIAIGYLVVLFLMNARFKFNRDVHELLLEIQRRAVTLFSRKAA